MGTTQPKLKIGFIPAHRDLVEEEFAIGMRERVLKALQAFDDIQIITPDDTLTKGGLVRNEKDSEKVIDIFSKAGIDAIIIGAVTYGDERSALSIVEKYSDLPVFLFAVKEPGIPEVYFECASSCGAMAISYGLHKRKINFTFGGITNPEDGRFVQEFNSFIRVALAVKKFRNARIGMIGLRPGSFEICIINEGLMLEKYRQKVIPINLIDLKHTMDEIKDSDPRVNKLIDEITSSVQTSYKKKDLVNVAKLELIMLKYAEDYDLDAFAIQCWTSIQEYVCCTPCMTMGRITHLGYPAACEGDILGALSMMLQRELTFEQGIPLTVDVVMQHPEKKSLFLAWHCGNTSKQLCAKDTPPRIMSHYPYGNVFGKQCGLATMECVLKLGVVTMNRIVEHAGAFKVLNVVGEIVSEHSKMRGSWAWVKVKDREKMYRTIFNQGFPQHVSLIHKHITKNVEEVCKYLDMEFIGI